jgi:MraZ protein
MFRGRYEHTIDGKGRTSLPARYRDALEANGERRIVLTSALDPCLVAYAMQEWTAFEERLGKLPQFDRAVQKLKRIYVSGAVECERKVRGALGQGEVACPLRHDRGRAS